MRTRRLVLPAALLAGAVSIGAWVVVRGDAPPAAEHPIAVVETSRTVEISASMPAPSTHPRHLSAMLEGGSMPPSAMEATVLTDSECTPDRRMISRCRNEVRLADGRTMVLRHPHDMTRIPCLAPGERVTLVPTGA